MAATTPCGCCAVRDASGPDRPVRYGVRAIGRTGCSVGFFLEFLKDPRHTGAIAPSSAALAEAMLARIDFATVDTIVEFGAGTGPFSVAMLERIRASGRAITFLAIERNPEFVDSLARRLPPEMVVAGDVREVGAMLAARGRKAADYIVSGLPWAAFSAADQDQLLAAAVGSLRAGGGFATFAYLQGLLIPAGRRFAQRLHDSFARVETSATVWRNLPPAFVYYGVTRMPSAAP
jgi:phosphatidylethanolamine/phosphatidyl-N-methylethanolamine N-methyltransferase